MSASEIEQILDDNGVDVEGVVVWENRQEFYAVGYAAADLPDIDGYRALDDPSLAE